MKYVGVGPRFLAFLIDAVILSFVALILGVFGGSTTGAAFEVRTGSAFLAGLIGLAYFVVCEVTMGGTPGKLLLGLRVVRADGCPITWGESIIRNIARIVDGLLLYLVAAIFIWSSDERQRLGDRLAHTYVVRAAPEEIRATCPGPVHI